MDVERRLLKLVLFILISCMFVSFCIGGHSEELKNPATQAACRFADALLTYAADHYGPQQTPFFVQMLELDTLTLPAVRTEQGWRPRTSGEWQEAMKNWPDDPQYTMWGKWFSNVGIAHTANFSNDLYTVQGLYELTDVTGDSRYRKAAEDYYRFFLEHMVSPVTGFWAWGFHMSWDVLTDELRGNRHELERVIPPWDVLWKFDSKAVTGEIAGLYAHVKDKETFAFDRHARFTDFFPESETNGYNEYAMRYINAWIYLYVKTGDSKYLDWAHRMLLSRRSKTADITDVFPYLWNPDLDRPIGLGWQNSLNIATYLLDAYRLYPDPWLLDPALQIVSRYQGGAPVNWGGETFGVDAGARALPLAYEITRDPHIRQQMLTAAEAFLIAQPPEIQMAQSGGQNLFFLLDVYMATGDPKWWEACQNNLATTVKIFQHPSGLIRGTAGLKRPDFYDASQGSGDLFAAWTRTAYLERNPVLVGWQFPPAVSPGTKSVRIEARVHLPEKNPTVFLNYRFVDKGSYRRVAGKIENGTAIFLLPIPSGSKSPIEWRGEIGSPAMWHSGLFRIALTSDTTPPRIGKPTWDALMPNDEPATVAVPITDDTGLEQAILHYTYGDRIGFSDVVERPSNGDVRFKIRNDPAFEGTIAFFVEAVDSSPARNTSLSEWHSLKSYTRVRKEFDPNKGTQDTVAADLVLSLSCTIPLPVILERTPWVPTGATETNTGLRKYYHIQADRWAESVTAANMSVKLNPEDHVGIVPESIRFARWTDQWTDVPSRLDLTGGRVGTSEVSPGWWKIEALSRCKWTHSIMHGETAAPSLSDLDGDGTLEVVSAMGGGPPWGAILDAYGNELARLDVGERVRQSGNYSGVAVTDVDEDGQLEILIGSADTHLYCFDITGKRKWRTLTDGLVRGGVAVGDIDGDGHAEIATASDSGTVFVLRSGGDILWSRNLGENTGGTPVLAELDGKLGYEILYVTRKPAQLWALNAHGENLWTASLTGLPCDPSVGDLNGDGIEEIVVAADCLDESVPVQGTVFILDQHGHEIKSFPVRTQKAESRGIRSVALADVDADHRREIILECGDGGLYCMDAAGQERWCFMTKGNLYGFPSFADLDNDGKTDMVIAAGDWHIYALRGDGKLLWTHKGIWTTAFSSIADIDRDGLLEVVYNSPRIPGLTALRTDGKAAQNPSPWPTMRGNLLRTGTCE